MHDTDWINTAFRGADSLCACQRSCTGQLMNKQDVQCFNADRHCFTSIVPKQVENYERDNRHITWFTECQWYANRKLHLIYHTQTYIFYAFQFQFEIKNGVSNILHNYTMLMKII